jgi:hypothetical protein
MTAEEPLYGHVNGVFDSLLLSNVVTGFAENYTLAGASIQGGCDNCGGADGEAPDDEDARDMVELILRILNSDPAHTARATEMLRVTLFGGQVAPVAGAYESFAASNFWDVMDPAPTDELPAHEEVDVVFEDAQSDDNVPATKHGAREDKFEDIQIEIDAPANPPHKSQAPPVWEEVSFEAAADPYVESSDATPQFMDFNHEMYQPDASFSEAKINELVGDMLLGLA